MSVLKLAKGLSVFLLGLEEIVVPLLVELLVLLDVRLLALLTLLRLLEDQLLSSSVVVLQLKLVDSVLSHFSFDVLALDLASLSVLLKNFTANKLVKNKRKLT